jgi:hypothetical protein
MICVGAKQFSTELPSKNASPLPILPRVAIARGLE